MRKLAALAVLPAALVIAGCGSSHPSPPKHTSAPKLSKSFRDGEKVGLSIAIPNSTPGEIRANCGVVGLQQRPSSDVGSEWMAGCILGAILSG